MEQSGTECKIANTAVNKIYFYLNEARDILGPVSEETLKELPKAGVLGAPPRICEKVTETWLYFSDVFPNLMPSSEAGRAPSAKATPSVIRKPQALAPRVAGVRHSLFRRAITVRTVL